jgi:hypothetical protein
MEHFSGPLSKLDPGQVARSFSIVSSRPFRILAVSSQAGAVYDREQAGGLPATSFRATLGASPATDQASQEQRMSRLDSVILRLEAQRACLNLAAEALRDLAGPVLELGLGNGRSYDHLREILPEREIFVFDREVASHPDCRPDPAHLFLGELSGTLPDALDRLPGKAALAHCDLGTWNAESNARLARWLAGALPPLLLEGAFVASDQPLPAAVLVPVPPPSEIDPDRYFLYKHRSR